MGCFLADAATGYMYKQKADGICIKNLITALCSAVGVYDGERLVATTTARFVSRARRRPNSINPMSRTCTDKRWPCDAKGGMCAVTNSSDSTNKR